MGMNDKVIMKDICKDKLEEHESPSDNSTFR